MRTDYPSVIAEDLTTLCQRERQVRGRPTAVRVQALRLLKSGASLAHHLRQQGNPLPVVLMSAVYAEVDLPGVRFLRKPINCEHLLDIIAAALRGRTHATRGDGRDDWTSPAQLMG